MGKNHLDNNCTSIPEEVRSRILRLKQSKRRASGGKTYWAESAKFLGIVEDQYGLRFSKESPNEGKESSADGSEYEGDWMEEDEERVTDSSRRGIPDS